MIYKLVMAVICQTDRMIIRVLDPDSAEDVALIYELLNSEPWRENIAHMPHVTDIASARKYILDRPLKMWEESKTGMFAMVLKPDATGTIKQLPSPRCEMARGDHVPVVPVGVCGLIKRAELDFVEDLGFALLPQFHGLGLALEGCRGILDWAREVKKLPHVLAITRCANDSAVKLLEKLQFTTNMDEKPVMFDHPHFVYRLELGPSKGGP